MKHDCFKDIKLLNLWNKYEFIYIVKSCHMLLKALI